MSVLLHLLAFLVCALLGGGEGFSVLRTLPQMTIEVGHFTGVVVFGIFGSLHQTVTPRRLTR